MSRLWRKQRKIEAKLNDDSKPKWMRWRTYDQMIEQINAIEEQKDDLICIQLAPYLLRNRMQGENPFDIG